MRTVAEIEQELREARNAESEAKKARREAVPADWRFTITPTTNKFDTVYDDTCRLYELVGEVVNEGECKAAGHDEFTLRGGGMTYVFNTLSGKIIMATGGGTIYIGSAWNKDADGSDVTAFNEINAFLADHPKGGDVTEIVLRHRERRGQVL